MKTSVGALVLLGAVMSAGLALAQTPPPQRSAPAEAGPGGEPGQTRAHLNQSGGVLASERAANPAAAPGLACAPDPAGGARRSTDAAATPVNGVGGQGGGRLSNRDHIDQDARIDIRTGRSAPANPPAPGAGGLATGNTYTTGDFAGPELRRAGDPRGPGADSAAPAAPACEPTPAVRR